jgi:hypothetical protein
VAFYVLVRFMAQPWIYAVMTNPYYVWWPGVDGNPNSLQLLQTCGCSLYSHFSRKVVICPLIMNILTNKRHPELDPVCSLQTALGSWPIPFIIFSSGRFLWEICASKIIAVPWGSKQACRGSDEHTESREKFSRNTQSDAQKSPTPPRPLDIIPTVHHTQPLP